MKKTTLLVLAALLVGCATTSLMVTMVTPPSETSSFENDHVKVAFTFAPSATLPGNPFTDYEVTSVGIDLMNRTSDPLKIMWDDISLIIDGQAHRIIHTGVRLIEKEKPQAPTTVPPGASLVDQITPVDNIYILTDTWAYRALINKYETGRHSIRVYLPYILNEQTHYIDCEFQVKVVK